MGVRPCGPGSSSSVMKFCGEEVPGAVALYMVISGCTNREGGSWILGAASERVSTGCSTTTTSELLLPWDISDVTESIGALQVTGTSCVTTVCACVRAWLSIVDVDALVAPAIWRWSKASGQPASLWKYQSDPVPTMARLIPFAFGVRSVCQTGAVLNTAPAARDQVSHTVGRTGQACVRQNTLYS